jgi:hypothetical protein
MRPRRTKPHRSRIGMMGNARRPGMRVRFQPVTACAWRVRSGSLKSGLGAAGSLLVIYVIGRARREPGWTTTERTSRRSPGGTTAGSRSAGSWSPSRPCPWSRSVSWTSPDPVEFAIPVLSAMAGARRWPTGRQLRVSRRATADAPRSGPRSMVDAGKAASGREARAGAVPCGAASHSRPRRGLGAGAIADLSSRGNRVAGGDLVVVLASQAVGEVSEPLVSGASLPRRLPGWSTYQPS